MVVRSGPHGCLIIDAEVHPAGDVRLWRRRDGWMAHVLTREGWGAYAGHCYIEHLRTCRPAGQRQPVPS
jgi:hypothetical protein